MNWSKQRVLVTGACGFIGSHLAEQLVRLGADVRAMVFYNARNSWGWLEDADPALTKNMDIVTGDIRDPFSVARAVEGRDIVFHLAALISIPYSYAAPASYVQTNTEGTLNLLEASLKSGARMIHTSTSEVYGSAQYVPIDEAHPIVGQSPYSASKIGADMLAVSFYRSFQLPVTIVRPFNTYGPRQSARAVIPTIISQLLHGGAVRLGSLHPTRDLNFVSDTVDGFIAAGATPKAAGEVINIGSQSEISIGDLAELIARIMDKEFRCVTDKKRIRPKDSEVDRLFCNAKKAKKLLNWKSKVRLEAGLRKTIPWVEANLSKYKHKLYNV